MITVSEQGSNELIADLSEYPKGVTRVMVRALNRAIASGRAVIAREMARDTGMTVGAVKDAITLREATMQQPSATLAASLKRIPLIDFRARGPEPSRGQGRGVTYRLPSGQGRHPNAFIATMRSGHRGVFARTTKARLPIRELFGPSLGHVFAKFRPLGLERTRESFETNFAHEMDFERSRSASGSD